MVELSLDGDTTSLGFAGDSLNTAIYLRRGLSQQYSVSFVSAIGADPLSQRMLRFISAQGVRTDHLAQNPEKLPGLYAINTDEAGERSFLYWRENSAACAAFDQGFDALSGFDLIYLSAISLAIVRPSVRDALLTWLENWPGRVAFDSNYRPRLWESQEAARVAIARAWQRADIGLPSLDDEQALFTDSDEQTTLHRLQGYGLKTGALKRGPLGPRLLSGQTIDQRQLASPAQIVDTTAAGDSFNGAFLAVYLSGGSQEQAAIAGHALACKVIGHRGAILASSPSNGEVSKL